MSGQPPAVDVWLRHTTDPRWVVRVLRQRAADLAGAGVGDVALGHLCPRCGGSDHGRPHLLVGGRPSAWTVSISRTARLSAAALGRGGAVVGVDVERVAGDSATAVRAVARHPAERVEGTDGLARLWARKESLLKALGVGLAMDPASVRLTEPPAAPAVVACAPLAAAGRRSWLTDLAPGPGLVGCLTVLSDRAPTVSLFEGAPAAGSSSATR